MIITDENILRQPCADVAPSEVGELRALLESELENSARLGRPGIGLAAPQIGIHKKIAIVRLGPKDLVLDLVNCSISHKYDEFVHMDEGCLSFPNRVENVIRHKEIHIINNLVHPKAMILTELLAVCAEHEIDHLNGVLLPDVALPKQKVSKKVGPNDLCPCGSNKKYKKCCRK